MTELKDELIDLIASGKEVSLKWDCGGDQAVITIFLDGQRLNYHDEFAKRLDIYLINFLNLPDVGDFEMEGQGRIIEHNGEIYLEYESIMKGYLDFGEQGEKEEWVETNEREEQWSGKKELFKE
jgi:hypothetical protein